jgi:predicted cobalt transporter CbtA
VNANALLASVVVGSVGLGFFMYGKRQQRVPHLVVGLVLMVFPYLVGSVGLMAIIAAGLIGLLAVASYVGL